MFIRDGSSHRRIPSSIVADSSGHRSYSLGVGFGRGTFDGGGGGGGGSSTEILFALESETAVTEGEDEAMEDLSGGAIVDFQSAGDGHETEVGGGEGVKILNRDEMDRVGGVEEREKAFVASVDFRNGGHGGVRHDGC
jgi:hypothetical protein